MNSLPSLVIAVPMGPGSHRTLSSHVQNSLRSLPARCTQDLWPEEPNLFLTCMQPYGMVFGAAFIYLTFYWVAFLFARSQMNSLLGFFPEFRPLTPCPGIPAHTWEHWWPPRSQAQRWSIRWFRRQTPIIELKDKQVLGGAGNLPLSQG